jgi:cell division transport system permease protein
MRFKYVLNEVLVGLWRNVTMTIAMVITMSISLLGVGASVMGYMQVDKMKQFYYEDIEVAIFMLDNASEENKTQLKAALDSNALVESTRFESREAALAKFQEMWKDSPEFVNAIKANDLPESFRVKLKNPEAVKEFTKQVNGLPGISDIVDQRELLEKVFNLFSVGQNAALLIAAFMALAALLLVGNTIQVAAYSKRREVAVMKLVGASNWFIQAPFVLEAVVAGLIGAIIGWVALLTIKLTFLDSALPEVTAILTEVPTSNAVLMLPLMAGAGAVASAATAWITLRFYLKV